MSESQSNATAMLAASLPNLLPHGFHCDIDLQLQVIPKVNVMLVPPHRLRTTAQGQYEVLVGEPEEWRQPPAGVDVCEMGKPLPPEKCDIAVVIGSVVEDMLGPKLVAPGQQPRGKVSSGAIAIVARKTLADWQHEHMAALRGPVE